MPASRKITLKKAPEQTNFRVVRYVNDRFKGNLSAAARAIGCSYASLYMVTRGVYRPNVALLQLLAAHSGKTIDWWITGEGT